MSYTLFYEAGLKTHNIDEIRHSLGSLLYRIQEDYEPRQRITFDEKDIRMLRAMAETDWSQYAEPAFEKVIKGIEKFGSADVWLE